MKILALCVDWDMLTWIYGHNLIDRIYDGPDRSFILHHLDRLRQAAARFGAKVYLRQEDLERDYPQPDISELLRS